MLVERIIVVSTYAVVNQLDIESSIDEILPLQARHFWNDIVKNFVKDRCRR